MNAKTMRAIDWYIGVPACYTLAVYEFLRSFFPRRRTAVKNILFIKFFGIGSIMLSSPAVAAVRGEFPDVHIHYLTFASNRGALSMLKIADTVHYIDATSLGSFVNSTPRTIVALWHANIDIVFDIEFFAKFPLIIATLIGAKRKAGFYLMYEPWRRRLLDDYGCYNSYWHVKDIFLALVYLVKEQDPYYLRFAAYRERYVLPKWEPEQETLEKVRTDLKANGWTPGRKLLLLNPNSSTDLAPIFKQWSSKKWCELIERLHMSYPNALMVMTGASSETEYVESIISLLPPEKRAQVRNSAGMFSLPELLSLFSFGDIFITIDSGPMHLATLTEIPIVGLIFAGMPGLDGPLSKNARAIAPKLYSLPTWTVYTGKESLLLPPSGVIADSVSADEVFAVAQSLLERSP